MRVEELVVELGEAMGRLARTLLARVAGPAGWAAFGDEVALKGLDAFTDIVDDVRTRARDHRHPARAAGHGRARGPRSSATGWTCCSTSRVCCRSAA